MKIIFLNKQRKHKLDFKLYKIIVDRFIYNRINKYKDYKYLELYISFVSPQKIRNLKNNLFGLNIITDVISLPMDTEDVNKDIPSIFGEIFICPAQAFRQAKEFKTSFKDELSLLIVHGLLHLIGYEDQTEEQQEIMRREEQIALKE